MPAFGRHTAPELIKHDRERGILSPVHRLYLLGDKEYSSDQSEINARQRIRDRIRHSIIDFYLITRHLSETDQDLVFDDPEDEALRTGLESMAWFLYASLKESAFDDFERVVREGVRDAEFEHHWFSDPESKYVSVDVNFHVDIEDEFDVNRALSKFERGEALTPDEIGGLLLTGTLSEPDHILSLAAFARDKSRREGNLSQDLEIKHEEWLGDDWNKIPGTPFDNPIEYEIESTEDDAYNRANRRINELIQGNKRRDEEKRTALHHAVQILFTENDISKATLVEQVFTYYPVGYDSSHAWWTDFLIPNLRELPGIEITDPT